MKNYLCCVLFVSSCLIASSQTDSLSSSPSDTNLVIDSSKAFLQRENIDRRVYHLKPSRDIPVFAVGAGWSGYAFTKIYSKDRSSEQQILSLDKKNINGFDRQAVRPYSAQMGKNSNVIFYGSVPLPFLFLAFKDTRKDFLKLSFLYLEAMSITGFLYTGSVYFNDRYRPYAYSDQTPMEWRTRGGAKNSFYAGHVALAATSGFFMAKVYADYNPHSKIKWLFYSLAGASTATMAYFRHRGGFHFPSDILIGMVQGTLTGILVPHFHKNKSIGDSKFSLLPYSNGEAKGFSLVYKFK